MDNSIMDDCKEILSRYNFSADDFSINEKNLTRYAPNDSSPLKREVTVRHKTTNKEGVYKSGNATQWLVEFENDLKKGYFD